MKECDACTHPWHERRCDQCSCLRVFALSNDVPTISSFEEWWDSVMRPGYADPQDTGDEPRDRYNAQCGWNAGWSAAQLDQVDGNETISPPDGPINEYPPECRTCITDHDLDKFYAKMRTQQDVPLGVLVSKSDFKLLLHFAEHGCGVKWVYEG